MKETNLTEGSVFKTLIKFALPMAAATLLQSLYGIVDMIITGRFCGDSALSGLAIGNNIMTMISFIGVGLSTGGNVVIGQYYGAKDDENRKQATVTCLTFMVIVGIALTIILLALLKPILLVLNAPAYNEAWIYMAICAIGCIFIMGYNALSAIMRAVGDSKTPLKIIILAAITNVGLDLLLVAVFNKGIAGAAIATLCSQIISFGTALIHILKAKELFGFDFKQIRLYKDKLKLILKIGVPSATLFCINGFTHLFNTGMINAYGVVQSAACGCAYRISDVSNGFVTATMNASATMDAQCIGACKYSKVKQVLKTHFCLNVVLSLSLTAIMTIAATFWIGLFNKNPDVISVGAMYLRVLAPQAFTFIFFTTLHAVATGAGDSKLVMWNSLLGLALPRIIMSYIFNHFIGLNGIALACVLAPLFAIPAGVWYFTKNKWQHRMISEEK